MTASLNNYAFELAYTVCFRS